LPEFHTRNPAFQELLVLAERAARSQANVFLTGESGTGKNRLAKFIHDRSDRCGGPLVEVVCANIPADLLESDLFGHQKGAFTDAHEDRPGRFEQAEGGTILLDEVQDLGLELQAKVLRAIAEKRFERVGGRDTIEVDVRIIASSRENPDRLVDAGRLREDLYYRLNVVRLDIPPLRVRSEDIGHLATLFLKEALERHRLPARTLSAEVLRRLEQHSWPGNARELRHVVESAAVMAAGGEITMADLPRELSIANPSILRSAAREGLSLVELEDAYIDEVLRRTNGNKSAAARILGIHRKTLYEKLRARASRGGAEGS
jgi:DNA-binding NtrC family response regulator